MGTKLLARNAWRRITALTRRASRARVAVPFFGTGGTKLLPLRSGSLLVVRFDSESIRSGQTNPAEILKLIRSGVEVHACRNLHAKVFVFGRTAVVGSTNVSRSSAGGMIEAAVETQAPVAVRAARTLVESLRGDVVGQEFALKMLKLYKPPRPRADGGQRRRAAMSAPVHSTIWAVPLERMAYDEVDWQNQREARRAARPWLANARQYAIDDFCWTGGGLLDDLAPGHRVVMCTEGAAGVVMVSPPASVLSIKRYKVRNEKRGIVCVEIRKNKRNRSLKRVIKAIGPAARLLRDLRSARRLRNQMLVYSLGSLWSR